MKRKWLILTACICMSFGMVQANAAAVDGTDQTEVILEENQEELEAIPEQDPEVTPEVTPEIPAEDPSDDPAEDSSDDLAEDPAEVVEVEDPEQALDGTYTWKNDGSGWKYENEAGYVTGRYTVGDNTYFFDEKTGILKTGFVEFGGKSYYFAEEGASPEEGLGVMTVSAWIQLDNGSLYYAGKDGALVTGWQSIGGKTFYFNETGTPGEKGKICLGWQTIDGKTFYFKKTGDPGVKGQMFVGWISISGKTYYFKKTGDPGVKGQMYTGWITMSGKTYYFQKGGSAANKGKMYTGWYKIDGKIYYFQKNGANGNKGQLYTGWRKLDNKIFYFKPTGANGVKGERMTGWQTIGSNKFYFQKNGAVGTAGKMYTGWITISGKRYYFQKGGNYGSRGKMYTGWRTLDGSRYYLGTDGVMRKGWLKYNNNWYYLGTDGKMATGWKYINVSGARYSSYKFFFNSNGTLMQDVSGKIGRQSSYYTEVDRVRCTVVVYAKDETGQYRIPVKTMTCSVGLPGTETPTGTFNTMIRYRWKELMGPSWGQYATRIVGGVLFHSVAGSAPNSHALPAGEYNRLGQPASHGCVRLCVRDAKWIYDNCPIGMTVKIGDNLYQPFDKPATIKIPASQNWDPTDPAV